MVILRRCFVLSRCLQNQLNKRVIVQSKLVTSNQCFSTESTGRYYTRKHEWVAVDGQLGTIGISNFAQSALGEIVFVQLPEVDKKLNKGDECGALESVKAAGEVYSPVSGTVVEVNSVLDASPSTVNESCYEKGWLFKIKLSDLEELKTLLDEMQYAEYLKNEAH